MVHDQCSRKQTSVPIKGLMYMIYWSIVTCVEVETQGEGNPFSTAMLSPIRTPYPQRAFYFTSIGCNGLYPSTITAYTAYSRCDFAMMGTWLSQNIYIMHILTWMCIPVSMWLACILWHNYLCTVYIYRERETCIIYIHMLYIYILYIYIFSIYM